MIESGIVRLSAVGDVALGGAFAGAWGETVPHTVAHLAPILAEEDINLLSLDCTFGQGAPPNPEEYVVCAPAETLTLLQQLRINVVSQANNHSLDLGTPSLLETQQMLKERDIEHVGAGLNLKDACRPLVLEVRGVRVGFLAYSSTHPWVGGFAADESSAGVAPLDPDLIEANLCQLEGKTDCVVVSVHWGKENLHYPPPECVELGRQIIDWGARIVVGYHPHMIQGYEEYGGGHICYSLGNFLFSDYPDQRLHFLGEQRESLLVRFAITRETVTVEEFVPLEMNEDYVVSPMKSNRKSEVLQLLATWSNAVQAPDYDDYWRRLVRRAELKRLSRVFRDEVVAAGWSGGTRRLLSVGGKGARSIGRSVYEILGFGMSER
jgi:poly-gamma-glutamate capsule biosynthesis protein CapA/YwtB (metallophosphatase superfamily)